MKKLITCISAFAICTITNAQRNASAEDVTSGEPRTSVVFGIKGGFNRSNVFDEQGKDFVAGPKTGGVGGIFLSIPIGRFLGVQPEALISQKGFEGSGTIDNQPYTVSRTSTFLDIPLQLQLKPFGFFTLLGGIQYSYLLKQKDEFIVGSNYEQLYQEFRNDNIRRNIMGTVIGFDINIRHIVLSARSGWDVIANHGDGNSSSPRYKNLWLQGTIGYRFY